MKRSTNLWMIAVICLFSVWNVSAQTFTWDRSELTTAWADKTAASVIKETGGIKLEQIGTAGVTGSNAYIDVNGNNANLVLNSTSNDAVTITSSSATISSIKISYSANGGSNTANPYIGYHTSSTAMGSANATVSACEIGPSVTGTAYSQQTFTPPANTKFIILARGRGCGETAASTATFRISRIEVYTQAATPSAIISTAQGDGEAIQSIMQTESIVPIKYTLEGGATNAATVITWLCPGANTNQPDWITVTNENETISISGTTTATTNPGDYTYTVTPSSGSAAGTAVSGTITVTEHQVLGPEITTPSNASQAVKAGKAIGNIVFTFTNAKNATVTGILPNGVTAGTYDSENQSISISGTTETETSYPAVYTYTVTATPLDGYSGPETFTATGTITVKDPATKTVAYLTTSAKTADDAIVSLLKESYDVVKIPVVSGSDGKTLVSGMSESVLTGILAADDYNLVVADEILDGATCYPVVRAAFTKPFLNLKPFFYNTGRWVWGTGDNGKKDNLTLTVNEPFHPVFKGIDFSSIGNQLDMLEGTLSTTDGKTLQGALVSTVSFGSNIGQIPALDNAKNGDAICIHEVPVGSTIGSSATTSKYLLIGIFNQVYSNLNANGKNVIKNACEYLMKTETFGTDANAGKLFKDIKFANVTITPNKVETIITWDAIPCATKYTVTLSDAAQTDYPATLTGTTATINDLPNATYNYTITAENAAGTKITDSGSFIVSVTAINGMNADKEIASETVYTLTGVQVKNSNYPGIYTKKIVYTDGSSKVSKFIVK